MDVRCEKCTTVYPLKDDQVGEGGIEVQCRHCGHKFRVARRPAVITREMAGLSAVSAQLSAVTPSPEGLKEKSKERPWSLRLRRTQEVLRFRDLGVLRQWIMDRRVSREDDISRGGQTWRRMGAVVELEALFHSADKGGKGRMQTGPAPANKSARSPAAPALPPTRLRSDTPGVGVGPVLPPQRAATLEPDRPTATIIGPPGPSAGSPRRPEDGPPSGLSSTGRTMRPRLRQPSPVSAAPTRVVPAAMQPSAPPQGAAGPRAQAGGEPTKPDLKPGKATARERRKSFAGQSRPKRAVVERQRVAPASAPQPVPQPAPRPAPQPDLRPTEEGPTKAEMQAGDAISKRSVPERTARSAAPMEAAGAGVKGAELTASTHVPALAHSAPPFPQMEEVLRRSDPVPHTLQQPFQLAPSTPPGPAAWSAALAETYPLGDLPGPDSPTLDEWEEPLSAAPRRRGWLGLFGALVCTGALFGAYQLVHKIPRGAGVTAAAPRGAAQLESGRRFFLADTDEDFQHAHDLFLRSAGADETNPEPLAALGELHGSWAIALGQDLARASAAAAPHLKKEIARHIELGRHYANQALGLGAAAPSLSRALALLLIEAGAEEQQVQLYLKQADRPGAEPDPALDFVHARLDQREHRPKEARAWLDKAVAADPPLVRALMLRGEILASAHPDLAEGDFRRVLALSPQHGRAKEALAALPRAPAAPDLAPAVTATAQAPTKAAPPAEEEEEEEPDLATRLLRAQQKLGRGRVRDAQRQFLQLVEDFPEEPEVHVGLGTCAADMERYQAAVGHYNDALRRKEDYPAALIGLGEVYKLRGDADLALRAYRRYLEKHPDGPQAQLARNNVARLEVSRPPAEPAAPAAPAPGPAPAPAPAPSPNP